MLRRGSGHIVSIASLAGVCGGAGLTDYCASKFYAYSFAESLRIEMRHLYNIGYTKGLIPVTTICPGFIDTRMFAGVKKDWLWPLLKTERVVDRIITAIRQEEGEVNIYWLQGILVYLCKCVMNSSLFDWTLYILAGYDAVLCNFKGREGPDAPL